MIQTLSVYAWACAPHITHRMLLAIISQKPIELKVGVAVTAKCC